MVIANLVVWYRDLELSAILVQGPVNTAAAQNSRNLIQPNHLYSTLCVILNLHSSLGQGGVGLLARLAVGPGEPVGRPLGGDQVDDDEGGQQHGQDDHVEGGAQQVQLQDLGGRAALLPPLLLYPHDHLTFIIIN